jgi:hypothetical protein
MVDKMNAFVGKVFRHYKGNLYQVVAVARHTELTDNVSSMERGVADLVVYKQLYRGDPYPEGYVWARPYTMFFDSLEVNGKTTRRFTPIEGENGWRGGDLL